jgi:hypothetical protein
MTYITPDPVAIHQDYLRNINGGRLPKWARVLQPSPTLKQVRPMMSPMSEDWRDGLPGAGGGGNITSLTGWRDLTPHQRAATYGVVALGLYCFVRTLNSTRSRK